MDRALILLFNHQLTCDQERDARDNLGVSKVVEPPEALRELWGNVPPELADLTAYLDPVKQWLAKHSSSGDYVLIQGDFGATYLMVNFAFQRELIPVYSTTQRQAEEQPQPDGSVRLSHRFFHKRYRFYGK
jgi:hypothetical protein